MSNNRQNHGEGRFDKIIRDVYNVKFENSLTLGHPRIYLLLLLRTYSNGQEIMGFWQSKLHVQPEDQWSCKFSPESAAYTNKHV